MVTQFQTNFNQDGAWEQQIASADFTPEEWQWVQEPAAEGYYYNSVTVSPTTPGRTEDPPAFPQHEEAT